MAGLFRRIGFAFKCLFLVLFTGKLPGEIPPGYLRMGEAGPSAAVPRDRPPEPAAAAPPVPAPAEGERAVQVLALLQRDGRLVDFLYEDISAYPDDQVGAAAREVHASCRAVLQRYLALEPVLGGEEGRPTTVDKGFDPGVVKLVGNVTGQPPYRGVLRHHGWRAKRIELPALPDGAARAVIAPAEVEIG